MFFLWLKPSNAFSKAESIFLKARGGYQKKLLFANLF